MAPARKLVPIYGDSPATMVDSTAGWNPNRQLPGMSITPAVPVPPVSPAVLPPAVPSPPLSRRTQTAALVLLLAIATLVGWRWYADHLGTRPTELVRDPTHRIDLNRATRSELMQVPGIGPRLADRIVAERDARGRFNQVEDLRNINGIGDATLNRLQIGRAHV